MLARMEPLLILVLLLGVGSLWLSVSEPARGGARGFQPGPHGRPRDPTRRTDASGSTDRTG